MTDFHRWFHVKNRLRKLQENELTIGKDVLWPAYNGHESIMIPAKIASSRTRFDSYAIMFDPEVLKEVRKVNVQIDVHACGKLTPEGNGYFVSISHLYTWKIYDDGLDNWE